jgi:hypothetical protein
MKQALIRGSNHQVHALSMGYASDAFGVQVVEDF